MHSQKSEEERGARGGVDRRSDDATSVDVEIDPHRRLGRLCSSGHCRMPRRLTWLRQPLLVIVGNPTSM